MSHERIMLAVRIGAVLGVVIAVLVIVFTPYPEMMGR